jgi:hypothetical protein
LFNKREEKYNAQGFVESLIAVAITGLAGVVLLAVSMNTIDQTLENEAYDEMTNASLSLNHKISYLVELHNQGASGDPIVELLDSKGRCFDLGDTFIFDLTSSDLSNVCAFNMQDGLMDRDSCGLTGEIGVFEFVCVNSLSNDSILYVDVVTGDIGCTDDSCNDFIDKEIYLLK